MSLGVVQVALASLFAGLAAGWIMHRADFCAVAALRDMFLFRDTGMFRAQLLLISVSLLLFHFVGYAGLQDYPATPFYGYPSLGNLLGGLLFGFGMVLAGGCVVGVLYRLGSGSWLALTAFIGLMAGSALYAEFHSWWLSMGPALQLGEVTTLPLLTGVPAPAWVVVAGLSTVILWRGFRQPKPYVLAAVRGHLAPHQAAVALALCGLLSLLFVGMPLGVSTSYAKMAAFVEGLAMPLHVSALDFFNRQPIEYTPPFSSLKLTGGGGSLLDAIALIQFPLIFGIVVGAFVSAWQTHEFKLRFRPPLLQAGFAFLGGALMGVASRLSSGCNVWHVWGGLPHLALSSILFFFGIVPGAWVGSVVIKRVVLLSQQEPVR